MSNQFNSVLSLKDWKIKESLIIKKFDNYTSLERLAQFKQEVQGELIGIFQFYFIIQVPKLSLYRTLLINL